MQVGMSCEPLVLTQPARVTDERRTQSINTGLSSLWRKNSRRKETCKPVEHVAWNAAPFFATYTYSKHREEDDAHDAHSTALHVNVVAADN